ncbi:unnamed protein product, partial [Ectocarpus sp. 13 AM-2016]
SLHHSTCHRHTASYQREGEKTALLPLQHSTQTHNKTAPSGQQRGLLPSSAQTQRTTPETGGWDNKHSDTAPAASMPYISPLHSRWFHLLERAGYTGRVSILWAGSVSAKRPRGRAVIPGM